MKKNGSVKELLRQDSPSLSSLREQYVVGIGASAGGLEAIQELFDNIPPGNNISFVIVQHLSPDYKSLMAELLSKHTPMQVYEAQDGMILEPSCVYVSPSTKTMTIKNSRIKLAEKKIPHVPNNAIDIFFKSLAEEKGSRSIAIVLSGTGTDGTKGVEAVKRSGGLVIVQDPVTAKFDGMPNSAIIAGYADFILSPGLMPKEIFNYVKELPVLSGFDTHLNEGSVVTSTDATENRQAQNKLQQAYQELLRNEEKIRSMNQELEERIAERTRDLAVTEERFRLVSMATNDVVRDWDLESNRVWWNESFHTLLGYEPNKVEVGIESWYNRLHPDDLARVKNKIQYTINSGEKNWSDEYRFCRADGTYAQVFDRGYLIHDENHLPVRMVSAMMDLSKLKEKEREQSRLTSIIENSTDLIGFTSLDGKIQYMNPAGLELIGLDTMKEATAKKLDDLFNEKDRMFFNSHIMPELKQKGFWEGEFQMQNFKNGAVLVHFNIFSTYDETSGKAIGYGTVTRDIRRELAFRRAITESAERLRLMANAMPQKVWTADANGKADYFNEQWMKYAGKSISELLGDGWLQVVHPDDKKENQKLWAESIRTGEPFQMERRLKRADGVYRWHLSRAVPHRDNEGKILGWVASSTDIDEQKKQEEKKDEFIGIASHELKTPLTSLKAYTQLVESMMKEEHPDIKKLQNYISKTGNYIEKLNSLVSDLLDVSKIQSGKLTFSMEDVDFDSMVMESLEMLQHTNHHKLVLEGTTGLIVKGDKARLEQVVENLVSNAAKYSPKAEKINITLGIENNSVKFSVTDHGIGIPPDKLDHIFNRFYRVEGMTHKFQGLGIGLFISSEIIKRHKGKIWAESIVGQGSTFHFILPVAGKAK